MNRADEAARILLDRRYKENRNIPVAFLDESYRSPDDFPGEKPFYLFTAVIVEPRHMASIRSDLVDISGSDYWHTTEVLREQSGTEKVQAMLRYLSEGDEFCVVAKKTEITSADSNLELARRECLLKLAAALTSGNEAGYPWPAVQLMVLERRPAKKMFDADTFTQQLAIREKIIPRNARIFQTSPRYENLLWLPDLVCSAARKELAHGRSDLMNIIREQVHYVDVQSKP